MMQPATQVVPFTEPQETQNHPEMGIEVECIDPSILQLVAFLFPAAPFEGLKFLALLCRATEKQLLILPHEGGQP